MLFNESFWVAVSILLFVISIFKYMKKSLDVILINRAAFIEAKLKDSQILKEEAEKLLEEHKSLHKTASCKAEEMLLFANKEITYMQDSSEQKLLTILTAKKNALQEKIKNDETKFLNSLRMQAVQLATATCISILHKDGFDKLNSKLIYSSLEI